MVSVTRSVGKTKRKGIVLAGRRFMILTAALPTAAFFLIWVGIPMVYSFVMSFFNWSPLMRTQIFLGLANYQEAFVVDPLVIKTLVNTFYYTVGTVPVRLFLALIAALMVNSLPRFKGLFRTGYFLPVVTSAVAVSVIWKWLYQPNFGLINSVLRVILVDTLHLQVDTTVPWLLSTRLAMPSIMIVSIWGGLGFTMVLFMAGLTNIPSVYYEAAKIDGAGRLALFRHITWPLISPTTVFVLTTGLIGGLQVFTQVYVMTMGGPANATKTLVFYLYNQAWQVYRFGYASALAFILFAIILVLALIQLRVTRTNWEY